MPNLNQTGPCGCGPMTGRGQGKCCGFARGWRRNASWLFSRTKQEELADLKTDQQMIADKIAALEKETENAQE